LALTSRNFGAAVRARLADWNPDLIASSEGGSNQLLVRSPWRIEAVRRHTLARRPERRRMLWARLRGPDARELCVANMHGSVHSVSAAPEQVLRAAERAVEWSRELPLIFGGDLNLRPATEPTVFPELERRFELAPPTGPRAIDHLLVRGLDLIEPPHALPDDVRRVAVRDGLRARLSDHACVVAVLGMR
jgi:endonuclease/exonuclease/phosphatase family metal-dependent hydrolase